MIALMMSSENPAAPQGTGTGSASKGTRNQGRTVWSRADGGTTEWAASVDKLDPITRQLGGERRTRRPAGRSTATSCHQKAGGTVMKLP